MSDIRDITTTLTDLTTSPRGVPHWFGSMLYSLKLSDDIGDAWDAVLYNAPTEWRDWVKDARDAEFVGYGDDGCEGRYRVRRYV